MFKVDKDIESSYERNNIQKVIFYLLVLYFLSVPFMFIIFFIGSSDFEGTASVSLSDAVTITILLASEFAVSYLIANFKNTLKRSKRIYRWLQGAGTILNLIPKSQGGEIARDDDRAFLLDWNNSFGTLSKIMETYDTKQIEVNK